jgi:ABC-2 type transport system permease protein
MIMIGGGKFYAWLLTGVLTVLLVGGLNLLLDEIRVQADLTDDQRYTLPDEARKIAARLEDTCVVTAYLSDPLPSYISHIPAVLKTRIEEFQSASDRKIQYKVVNPDSQTEEEKESLKNKGIVPRGLNDFQAGKQVSGAYYAFVLFQYGPKEELLDLLSLGQDVVNPMELQKALPFQVCARLVKLLNPDAKVGVIAEKKIPAPQLQQPKEQGGLGKDPIDDLQVVRQRIESHLEKMEDVNVASETVQEAVKSVIVFRPSDFNERSVFELDQALMRGQNVVLLLDSFATVEIDRIMEDYVQNLQAKRPIRVRELKPGLKDWLAHFGVNLLGGYLETKDCPEVQGLVPEVQMGPGGVPRQVLRKVVQRFPGMVVARSVDKDRNPLQEIASSNPMFAGLGSLAMIFPTALDFDEAGLQARHPRVTGEVVARSSPDTWRKELEASSLTLAVNAEDEKIPADRRSFPLILSLHGHFRSYFAGKTYGDGDGASDRPPRLSPDGSAMPAAPAESARLDESIEAGQLWIFADSDFAADTTYLRNVGTSQAMGQGQMVPIIQATMTGLINAVDNMTVGPELIAIRKPNLTNRTLDRAKMDQDDKDIFFRTAVFGPLVVVGLGLLMWIYRKLTTGATTAVPERARATVGQISEERS